MSLKLLTHSEQVALHLRSEIMNGRWRNVLPGVHALSKKLGVNHNTIHAALHLLEEQELLTGQGRGRSRRITLPSGMVAAKPLRLRILCYERLDSGQSYTVELLTKLKSQGFAVDLASKTLRDLSFKVTNVDRFVKTHAADAWIIIAGSREILEWFAHGAVPAFALFGRHTGLPIASSAPLKGPALVSVVDRLVEMGHRRIVMVTRRERRQPHPGPLEQRFLDTLEAQGLIAGKYNLPDWEEHPAGLRTLLGSLFQHTPPTALIVSEPAIYVAVDRFLSQQGIEVPGQVSLVCCDFDPVFKWFELEVSHIQWNQSFVVNRVVRWASNTAQGKEDRKQSNFKAKWIQGATTGQVSKGAFSPSLRQK